MHATRGIDADADALERTVLTRSRSSVTNADAASGTPHKSPTICMSSSILPMEAGSSETTFGGYASRDAACRTSS